MDLILDIQPTSKLAGNLPDLEYHAFFSKINIGLNVAMLTVCHIMVLLEHNIIAIVGTITKTHYHKSCV